MTSSIAEDQKIRDWQKDVVRSIADDAPVPPPDPPPIHLDPTPARSIPPPPRPVVVNQIVTSPQVVVTRVKAPEPKPSEEISTKAMIGTVVGATAGAFIAYAMIKGDSENHQPAKPQQRITYRTIEAPVEYTVSQCRRIAIQDAHSHHDSYANGNSGMRTLAPPPARAETLVSASEHLRHSGNPTSQSYKVLPRDGPIVMIDNEKNSSQSRASTGSKTIRQQHFPPPTPSAPITEVRTARDVPLQPHSQASRYSRATSATVKEPRNTPPPPSSISPQDSVSQASTRRTRDSARSKQHHSSHHGRSRDGHGSEREYEGGKGSKAGRGSKVGEMVDDVVGIIKGTSVKGSEHR